MCSSLTNAWASSDVGGATSKLVPSRSNGRYRPKLAKLEKNYKKRWFPNSNKTSKKLKPNPHNPNYKKNSVRVFLVTKHMAPCQKVTELGALFWSRLLSVVGAIR